MATNSDHEIANPRDGTTKHSLSMLGAGTNQNDPTPLILKTTPHSSAQT